MSLIFGQRMVRIEDGMKGTVIQDGPDLRIAYLDRGEERRALKSEKWVLDELEPGPMRQVEKMLIAVHADRALRAFECHEPLKFWDKPDSTQIYDLGLVEVILAYLTRRPTRAANSPAG